MPDPSLEECEAFCQSLLDKFGWSPDVGTFHTYDGRDREMLKAILEHLRRLRPAVEALEEYADVDSWCCFECGGEYDTCNCKVDQWIPTEHGYELAQQALAAFENRSKS